MRTIKALNFTTAVSVYLFIMLTASVSEASEIISAENPDEILNLAKGYGSAKLIKDSDDDPFILGRINGNKYGIAFYGCSDGKSCDDIQFIAGWKGVKVSLKTINKWNNISRYGKASIDTDGDPRLIMSVNIDYGVTEENLDDSFNWWSKALQNFKQEVLEK